MKILIFGADGMLGSALTEVLTADHEIIRSLEKDLDITDAESLEDFILRVRPDWVINAAAYTDVDGCETHREKAFSVNADGPKYIAQACNQTKSKLIHFSTDYVFDGTKEEPYTEEDEPNPINVYGESKLKGEQSVQGAMSDCYIIRTQWLYGKNGKNFVDTICKLLRGTKEIKVVNDQIGTATFSLDLSNAVKGILKKHLPFGIYNIANSGYCSWFEIALEIARLKNAQSAIIPVSLEEFPRQAKRPKNSRLTQNKFALLGGLKLRHWKDALTEFLSYQKSKSLKNFK